MVIQRTFQVESIYQSMGLPEQGAMETITMKAGDARQSEIKLVQCSDEPGFGKFVAGDLYQVHIEV